MASSSNQGFYGQHRPQHLTTSFLRMQFMIDQMVKRISTTTLVQVKAITSHGTVDAPGTMDVTPMVNMLDGANSVSKHGTIYKVLFGRIQCGNVAIIMDPKPGDIGVMGVCDRDTSAVRKNKSQSNPGSKRRFDMADGVWLTTVLGPKPKTYIQATDKGTLILSNGQDSEDKPMQLVVGKDYVQMQKRGELDYHVTVDYKNGQIIAGMALVTGPNPFPDPPS